MNNLTKKWDVADDIDMTHLLLLQPALLWIFADLVKFCDRRSIPLTITSLVRPYDDGISKSSTHQEGRAIDISVKGWDTSEIDEVVMHFNHKYAEFYGTAPVGRPPQIMVPHDSGHGPHIHIQIRRQ